MMYIQRHPRRKSCAVSESLQRAPLRARLQRNTYCLLHKRYLHISDAKLLQAGAFHRLVGHTVDGGEIYTLGISAGELARMDEVERAKGRTSLFRIGGGNDAA